MRKKGLLQVLKLRDVLTPSKTGLEALQSIVSLHVIVPMANGRIKLWGREWAD